ncbi:hypothetical protein GCM10008924_23130 [Gracilibacillus halotolerans]
MGLSVGIVSSFIFAYSSYTILGFVGAYLSFMLIPVILWVNMKKRNKIKTT